MFLFDIKCFILVTIFENILVLEGLRKVREHVFTPHRSFYLRNDRRNNDFNYNFQDWETTTPDAFYYLNNKLLNLTEKHIYNQTLPKEETVTIVINVSYSVQTIPTVENLTIVTQETGEGTSKQEVVSKTKSNFLNLTSETELTTIQESNTTIYVTNSSVPAQNSSSPDIQKIEGLNITLPSEATLEDLLNWFATTSTNELYTSVIPPPPTVNVKDLMPGTTDDILDHTIPLSSSTSDPILGEIKEEIKKKHGYFTSSLHELLKILLDKNSSDFKKLLTATNTKIDEFIAADGLAIFGNIIVEVFQSVIQMMILAPDDTRKEYLNYAIYSVDNRHTALKDDVNSVFNVVDGIYADKDINNIALVLKRIEEFPNSTTDIVALVTNTLNAFVFDPHNTIIGTTKERLLLTELNYMLENRLYPGKNLGRRYRRRKENDKFRKQTKSTNIITDHQYSRKRFKYTTSRIHNFKYKSTIQNTRTKNIKRVQNIYYRKNAKDRYYVNKISTTIKNFYGDKDIKKRAFENSLQFYSSASSELSCSHEDSSGYSLESRYRFQRKALNDKYNLKSDERYFKANKKDLNKNKLKYKLEINKVVTKHKLVSTHAGKLYNAAFDKLISAQSAEENILKLNLIDALIHSGKTINAKKYIRRINKVRDEESISDYEPILKSNIYKVFGSTNNF